MPRSVVAAVARDWRFSKAAEVTESRWLKEISVGVAAESIRD